MGAAQTSRGFCYLLPRDGAIKHGSDIGTISVTGEIAGPRYIRGLDLSKREGVYERHGFRLPTTAAQRVLSETKDGSTGPTQHDPCLKLREWS